MQNRTGNYSLGLSTEQIKRRITELGTWFHNINLLGVETAPDHFLGDYPSVKWNRFAHGIRMDLSGQSVLDIGCNAGFYSIQMKLRGAARVVSIDTDETYLEQARFAAEISGVELELRKLSVYRIAELHEKFDLVLFMGVLYHLRHPLLALDLLHEYVVRDALIFQSMLRGSDEVKQLKDDYSFWEEDLFADAAFPKMYFVEKRYSHDPTNWWIPNRACMEGMLRSAGFQIVDHPEAEVFICKRGDFPETVNPTVDLKEIAGDRSGNALERAQ
ncbi:MAG: TIGR04290 family methyltransferase [Pyrinomonadaceae bacterium]